MVARGVFLELGFSEARFVDLMFESCLLQAVHGTIKSRVWKQVAAAVQLGMDQAMISRLMVGQMAGLSIERLAYRLSLLRQVVGCDRCSAPRGGRRSGGHGFQ